MKRAAGTILAKWPAMLQSNFAFFALAVVVSACSGGDDGSGPGGVTQATSCTDLAKTWCKKGCECTPGNECTLVRPNSSETHDSEKMCIDFYAALGCQTAPKDSAWVNGCAADLGAAQCAADGLTHPATCDW